MKTSLLTAIWLLGITSASRADTKNEELYLGLLHKLQFVEKYEDLKSLIPNCPPPKPYVGDDNTQIIIKTKLFGFDARGEFSFHKNLLVSHGFEIQTPTYKDAHHVFLLATLLLDAQVDGIRAEVGLPFGLDDEDGFDGPRDELNVYINGEHQNASFQLALSLREKTTVVRWGAQKVTPKSK